MKTINLLLFILITLGSCQSEKKIEILSQDINLEFACAEKLSSYKHHAIYLENDTINYHTYSKKPIDSIENIILYIHGSGAMPLFTVTTQENQLRISSSVPFRFSTIPDDYLFVMISKKSIPFCTDFEDYKAPADYFEYETLDYRAKQADVVIKNLIERKQGNFLNIVALGHSEGSDVIAKLGTLNTEVTHFGFWSGSGISQWYDFPLFVRQQVNRGELSEEEGAVQIDSLFATYRDIVANKDNIEKKWLGNSYKRWFYFSESPVENLLQIEKPIFVAMGTADQSVPIESVYAIPVEFIRKGKDNLSFNTYPDLDHSLNKITSEGKREQRWDAIFSEFLKWVEEN